MSVYPINRVMVSLDHKGGTKSYHLMLLSAASGASVVIFRWGKTGQFGEMQVHCFKTLSEAEKEFEKKLRSKQSGGYFVTSDIKEKSALNDQQLRQIVGLPIFAKMGAAAIKHLDPGFDTSGMREADPPRFSEDGENLESERRAKEAADLRVKHKEEMERLEQERRDREEAERRAVYGANPIFGAF